jgi:hypothetical protein
MFWSIAASYRDAGRTNGHAATLDEVKAKLRAA